MNYKKLTAALLVLFLLGTNAWACLDSVNWSVQELRNGEFRYEVVYPPILYNLEKCLAQQIGKNFGDREHAQLQQIFSGLIEKLDIFLNRAEPGPSMDLRDVRRHLNAMFSFVRSIDLNAARSDSFYPSPFSTLLRELRTRFPALEKSILDRFSRMAPAVSLEQEVTVPAIAANLIQQFVDKPSPLLFSDFRAQLIAGSTFEESQAALKYFDEIEDYTSAAWWGERASRDPRATLQDKRMTAMAYETAGDRINSAKWYDEVAKNPEATVRDIENVIEAYRALNYHENELSWSRKLFRDFRAPMKARRQAAVAFRTERPDEAAQMLLELIALPKAGAREKSKLAEIYLQLGKSELAVHWFEQAALDSTATVKHKRRAGMAFFSLKLYDRAIGWLTKAMEEKAEITDKITVADCYYRQFQFQEAIEYLIAAFNSPDVTSYERHLITEKADEVQQTASEQEDNHWDEQD